MTLYELDNEDRYIDVNRCATASCDSGVTHLKQFNFDQDMVAWGEATWTSTATLSILQTTPSQPFLQVVHHFGQWLSVERFSANWWTHSPLFGCITCPPGKHRFLDAFSGAEVCVWCGTGKYKTDTSTSGACTNCLPGRMTIYKGSTDISECICIGWEGFDGLCASCVAGKYRIDLVSDSCADCSVGKFSEIVNAQTDTCAYCGLSFLYSQTCICTHTSTYTDRIML